MQNKRIIAIIGATGAQGGGLVNAILNDPDTEFAVRAITRNTGSDKARELAGKGAEVVQADLDDKDSLVNAFKDAYGVFGVTNFWEHFSPEKETEQARNIAKAAEEAQVKHVIWSSLEDTRKWSKMDDPSIPVLQEKYKVPHFDSKGESEAFFLESDVPVTILRTSFYWDNMIFFGLGPKKGPDGHYALTFPMDDKKLPGMAAQDIGKAAYGIFKAGEELKGKTVSIAGEHLTGQQMAQSMSAALGVEVNYNPVSPETYRQFGFPGAEDLGNMFQFKRDFEDDYVGARDIEFTRRLNPESLSFNDWLEANKDRIPLD